MPQTQNGLTDNVSVGQQASTGIYSFYFNDPFDMLINLDNATNVITDGSAKDDKFNLFNSSNLIINGNSGNDVFNIAAGQSGLNGNVIHGGTGYNFVTATGSGATIDLTTSGGVSAVVGNVHASGDTVDLTFNELSSSALHNDTNRAFATVIGTDGIVNLTTGNDVQFVGSVNGAQAGFDANGNAITGTDLATLLSEVTSDASITGNLAKLYGTVPGHETAVKDLNAYVFTDGSKYYTLYSDGTVTATTTAGTSTTYYQPAPASPTTSPTYGSVSTFTKAGDWAGANIYTDTRGNPDVQTFHGASIGSSAILLTNGVTGVTVHGDNGQQGANYFGLGGSGGNNNVYASSGGSVFDLQESAALQDILFGGNGFDVVQTHVDGADVDLTANNATTATVSKGIDAVVGTAASTSTVEVDVASLKLTHTAGSPPSGVFEALLGSTADTLTLSSSASGAWAEVATFAPGSAPPAHASALVAGGTLDSLYHSGSHTAENSLTGYLFERLNGQGHVTEYLTIYTDATLVSNLAGATVSNAAIHSDYHL